MYRKLIIKPLSLFLWKVTGRRFVFLRDQIGIGFGRKMHVLTLRPLKGVSPLMLSQMRLRGRYLP